MPSSRHRKRRTLAALLFAAVASVPQAQALAQAPSSVRVVVSAADSASALLREAMVRAQGELAAVGLQAEIAGGGEARLATGTPRLERGVYGLLVLEQDGDTIVIHAWAPGATRPLDARVNARARDVTAEVIAVRAVETLRAAMLQFAQSARGDVPAAVRGFTRFEPARVAAPPPPTAPRPALAPVLAFWSGPSVSLQAGTSPNLGAQLGALLGPSFGFAAVAAETALDDLRLDAPHGSANVRRQAAWFQLGARFRPTRAWEIATRAGVGYAAFAITGQGNDGYAGRNARHGSPVLMLGVSTAYWATRWFGLYASVGGCVATDAPTIRVADTALMTLDRPSFVLSVGTSAGLL